MKKRLFAFVFAASLLTLGLYSCSNTTTVDEETGTVTILPVEHASVTSSITSGKVGDEGYLTITPESKDYRVMDVVQNDLFKLYEDENVKYRYPFTLKKGENTFSITMYYEEVIESDSDIIGPTNEEIIPDGELSDELDPIPTPGEDNKPAFENPVRVYFKDSSWWNQSEAGVGVISYDESGNIISENTALGDQMTHMSYNAAGGFNYFYIDIDGDNLYVMNTETEAVSQEQTNDFTARYLLIPDVVLYKARLIDSYAQRCECRVGSPTGYLFSDQIPEAFLGRIFPIQWAAPYKPKTLKSRFKQEGITRCNLLKKDFPHDAEAIAKTLGIRQGGNHYAAFTRIETQPYVLILGTEIFIHNSDLDQHAQQKS